MSRAFRQIIEQQIAKALASGQLDNLPGAGKPLPDRPPAEFADVTTQVATRIMAEAGVVPEEFKLRALLEEARAAWRDAKTEEERHLTMAIISDLELRYNVAVEARRKFMK